MQPLELSQRKPQKLLTLEDIDFDVPSIDGSAVLHHDRVDDKVRKAEEQLKDLQARRELLEREKHELEILSARQRTFCEGKDDLIKRLGETIPTLESQASSASRRAEFLHQMREVFKQHLKVLNTLNADEWEERNLKKELERGLSHLQEAEDEFERFFERLDAFGDEEMSTPPAIKPTLFKNNDFNHWMKMGFAFSLPLMVFTFVTLLIVYLINSN